MYETNELKTKRLISRVEKQTETLKKIFDKLTEIYLETEREMSKLDIYVDLLVNSNTNDIFENK